MMRWGVSRRAGLIAGCLLAAVLVAWYIAAREEIGRHATSTGRMLARVYAARRVVFDDSGAVRSDVSPQAVHAYVDSFHSAAMAESPDLRSGGDLLLVLPFLRQRLVRDLENRMASEDVQVRSAERALAVITPLERRCRDAEANGQRTALDAVQVITLDADQNDFRRSLERLSHAAGNLESAQAHLDPAALPTLHDRMADSFQRAMAPNIIASSADARSAIAAASSRTARADQLLRKAKTIIAADLRRGGTSIDRAGRVFAAVYPPLEKARRLAVRVRETVQALRAPLSPSIAGVVGPGGTSTISAMDLIGKIDSRAKLAVTAIDAAGAITIAVHDAIRPAATAAMALASARRDFRAHASRGSMILLSQAAEKARPLAEGTEATTRDALQKVRTAEKGVRNLRSVASKSLPKAMMPAVRNVLSEAGSMIHTGAKPLAELHANLRAMAAATRSITAAEADYRRKLLVAQR